MALAPPAPSLRAPLYSLVHSALRLAGVGLALQGNRGPLQVAVSAGGGRRQRGDMQSAPGVRPPPSPTSPLLPLTSSTRLASRGSAAGKELASTTMSARAVCHPGHMHTCVPPAPCPPPPPSYHVPLVPAGTDTPSEAVSRRKAARCWSPKITSLPTASGTCRACEGAVRRARVRAQWRQRRWRHALGTP